VGQVFKFVWRLCWKINVVCMSLSPFDSFQSRFVTYLLNRPRTIQLVAFSGGLMYSNTSSYTSNATSQFSGYYIEHSKTLILHSHFLCFPTFYTLFVLPQPNAHKNNVPFFQTLHSII
jgi:EamA domain-containing membrane protein RarD